VYLVFDAQRSREIGPPSTSRPESEIPEFGQVWWATVPPGDNGHGLAGLLDAAELSRWQRLRHPPDRGGYATAHALARLVIAGMTGTAAREVRFTAVCRHCNGPHGRPTVEYPGGRLHLSISHCGPCVAVAVAPLHVGVDVEAIALRGGDPPVRALSESEQRTLAALPDSERTAAFIRYWTRKEAVLKATGDGLLTAPARLTVSAPGVRPEVLFWADRPEPATPIFLTDLAAPAGHLAALASLGRPLRPMIHDGAAALARAAGTPSCPSICYPDPREDRSCPNP
jgi:4'-phosphopantetheinyl transferase